jgi:hypothetical protein
MVWKLIIWHTKRMSVGAEFFEKVCYTNTKGVNKMAIIKRNQDSY